VKKPSMKGERRRELGSEVCGVESTRPWSRSGPMPPAPRRLRRDLQGAPVARGCLSVSWWGRSPLNTAGVLAGPADDDRGAPGGEQHPGRARRCPNRAAATLSAADLRSFFEACSYRSKEGQRHDAAFVAPAYSCGLAPLRGGRHRSRRPRSAGSGHGAEDGGARLRLQN
jgi:hypothetical protein